MTTKNAVTMVGTVVVLVMYVPIIVSRIWPITTTTTRMEYNSNDTTPSKVSIRRVIPVLLFRLRIGDHCRIGICSLLRMFVIFFL